MGCCTACAVKIHFGEIYQPEALGIVKELKEKGHALMCVGFPKIDCVIETITEDEIFDLQACFSCVLRYPINVCVYLRASAQEIIFKQGMDIFPF